MTSQKLSARPLSQLAADINAAHEECAGAVRAGFAHAVRAGRLLLEAKARIPHGEWLPWVRRHCAFSERTAQAYMRVARGQLDATDPQRVARLSFRSALASLAAPREPAVSGEASGSGTTVGGAPAARLPGARSWRAARRAVPVGAPQPAKRAGSPHAGEAYGPNGPLIARFLERLRGLEFSALLAAVERWRAVFSEDWHEADRAAAAAIDAAGRHRERDAVLEAKFETFRRADWYRGAAIGVAGRPMKATSQYVATAALMALLVREYLAREHFETLYRPFAEAIPVPELERAQHR